MINIKELSLKFPNVTFATEEGHYLIHDGFVRDLRADGTPAVYHPQEYAGQASARFVVSQHPIYSFEDLFSPPDPREVKENERLQRRYTDEWVRFLKNEKLPVREVEIDSRVNQAVFDALCEQENVESLRIKWLTAKQINGVAKLKNLKKLFLECASSLTDISPVASLENLEVLILGQTEKVYDYSSLSALKKLKVLGICTYQTRVYSTIKVKGLDFISEMHALEYVDFIDVRVK